jgi:hypothetical protein
MDYPYMLSNNRISQIFNKILSAAKPPRFTFEFLRTLGFTSSNDQGFIPLCKKLGFLADDGTPTPLYDDLKDSSVSKKIIAEQIKTLYSDLFAINTSMNSATDDEIKGAISRITGKDETGVGRIFLTFKALCAYADFSGSRIKPQPEENVNNTENMPLQTPRSIKSNEFHYNIQIHLPATTDMAVYNAIFKSLRDNLLME